MAKPAVRGFAPADDVAALFRDKLASSGLDEADAASLGLTYLDATASARLGFWSLPALQIPYFDPVTGDPARHAPGWPEFYRVRALRVPANLPASTKFHKYLQPPDTGMCAYFPRIGPFDWADVVRDHSYQLLITEGELKAAKACREGFPTVGLGGVWNFRTLRDGVELLPSLAGFSWARREVVICYDSDVTSKPGVALAMRELAEELARLGAVPRMLVLPQPADDKVGLDDYLLDHSATDLRRLILASHHLTLSRALWDLNERWSFVEETASIVRHRDGRLMKPAEFSVSVPSRTGEARLGADGEVSVRLVSAGPAWIEWPLRSTVRSLAYEPSRPPFAVYEDDEGVRRFNVWPGFAVEPAKGDVSPFLEMVARLFEGAPESDRLWFLRWCACPLREPGVKMATSVVLHGVGEGTGKSSVGYTLRAIYGAANFSEITQSMLTERFNTWAVRKQLIMGDDITGSDKREVKDLLNKLITQRDLYVDEKNQPNYVLPDRANYMWTSNRPDAFLIGDRDRRFFVHEVRCEPAPEAWWSDYYDWLEKRGGAAAVFHYLRYELDMGDFRPFAPAPSTAAKEAMTRASHGSVGEFIRDLVALGPESLFALPDGSSPSDVRGRDLFTSREVLAHYQSRCPDDVRASAKLIAGQMAAVGLRQVHGGKPLLGADGRLDRFYAVRNGKRWEKASLDEIRAHLLGPRDGGGAKPAAPKKRRY